MSDSKKFKRRLSGTIVSLKSTNTVVVNVMRRFKHPKYKKFVFTTKKYHAHSVSDSFKVGDKVNIIESRPYSKLKRWEVL